MTLPTGGETLDKKQEQVHQSNSPDSHLTNKELVTPFVNTLKLTQEQAKQIDTAITTSKGNKKNIDTKVPQIISLLKSPEKQQLIQKQGISKDQIIQKLSLQINKFAIDNYSSGKIVDIILTPNKIEIEKIKEKSLNNIEKKNENTEKKDKSIEKNAEKSAELQKLISEIQAKNSEFKAGDLGKQFEEQKGQMNLPKNLEQQFNTAKDKAGMQNLSFADYQFSLFVKEQAKTNPSLNIDKAYLDNVQNMQDSLGLDDQILMPSMKKMESVDSTVQTTSTLDNIGHKEVYSKMENYDLAIEGLNKDLQLDTQQIDEQVQNKQDLMGLFAFPSTINSSSLGHFEAQFKDILTDEEIKNVSQWSVAQIYLSTPKDQLAQKIQPVDPKFVAWRDGLEQSGKLSNTKNQIENQLASMAKKLLIHSCDVQEKPMEMYMDYLSDLFKKQGDKFQVDTMKYNPDGSMTFDVHTKNLEGQFSEKADAQISINNGVMSWKSVGMDTRSGTMQVIEKEVTNNIATLDTMKIKPDLNSILKKANTYESPLDAVNKLYTGEYETTVKQTLNTTKNTGVIQSALDHDTTEQYFLNGMSELVTQGLYGQAPGENKQLPWRDEIKKGLEFDTSQTLEGRRLDLTNNPAQANVLRILTNTAQKSTARDMESILNKFQNSIMSFRKKGYKNEDLQKSSEPIISEVFTSEKAEQPDTMSNLLSTMTHKDATEGSRDAMLNISTLSNIANFLDGYSPDKADYTLEKVSPTLLTQPGTNVKAFEKLYEQKTTNGLDPDSYYQAMLNQLPDTTGDVAYKSTMSKFEHDKQAIST